MNQEEYIKQRLDDQIKWYERKSSICQKKYKFWQVIKIVAALLVTTLSLWVNEFKEMPYVIGITGAFIVFVESFVKIFDYEKLWAQYRSTAERLKREKLLFQTKSKPYNTKESFNFLVQRCEAIMQDEVQGWIEVISEKENDQS
ncbi:MAG TPA: DUF4231 domain-containing protein [Flavobacteriaceae bacterium]|nr:DUF4231 domain-containing protein [Flavobacteriaceae bacterium]